VEEAARKAGYRPNLMASSLRRRRSPFFGVSFQLTRDRLRHPIGTHPAMMWDVFEGITRAAQAIGRYPVFLSSPADDFFDDDPQHIDRIIHSGLSGVVASVPSETWEAHMLRWEQAGVHCVSIFDRGDRRHPRWYVDLDHEAVGRLAQQYLAQKGHTNVLCLWDWGRSHTELERLKAFRDAHRAQGHRFHLMRWGRWSESVIVDPHDAARLIEAIKSTGATAIFAAGGGSSMKAFQVLRIHEVRVPDDLSLLGMDVPTGVYEASIITEVVCPGQQLGYEAARLLARRIDGECAEPTAILVEPEIIERRSVAAI
jgi:LacI family transcriptional regulator